jgi:hypothetical protein
MKVDILGAKRVIICIRSLVAPCLAQLLSYLNYVILSTSEIKRSQNTEQRQSKDD